MLRSSGTEPKMKFYISVRALNYEETKTIEQVIVQYISEFINTRKSMKDNA